MSHTFSLESEPVRAAFVEAAEHFVATVGHVSATVWDRPGLGSWTIRTLVGHTSRALITVESYLSNGAEQVDIADSADYFTRVVTSTAEISERGRQAGIALGDDPAAAVRILADRVLPIVNRTPDTALVGTPWGGMRLIDYLPTRVFELTIHTTDLASAIGRDAPIPSDSSKVTWSVLGALARRQGRDPILLRAATGRGELPSGFSLLEP